ncbi:MAG: hypothetical protein DI539_27230 [Flavobacterium psychrophilum]|nr:MAG: hypothetical protein DI539_27230 [Flavobacterium psychrophilum]
MSKLFEQIGFAITSMAAVIFVLILTLLGLLTFTHTLFFEVLPQTITGWERYLASWMLALGWEFTLLITTCNTQFLHRRIPLVAAIASGVIVLFFIEAFSFDLPTIELLKRWFIGILVATINFIYTELFYAKWKELHRTKDLNTRITEIKQVVDVKTNELNTSQDRLARANADIERLTDYVAELEAFKKKEIDRLTCSHCSNVFTTVYHLNSHRGSCEKNPKPGHKQTLLEVVK